MLKTLKQIIPQDLTGVISLLSSSLAFIISILYFISGLTETLHYQIFVVGVLLLIPYLLNKRGHSIAGRLLLCFLLPVLVIILSIYNKTNSIALDIINPVNYFDTRLIIISSILLPMTLFHLSESKWLVAGILPSLMCIAFYDPIHIFFNVDYFQSGLHSQDYYFSANLFSLIAYFFLGSAFLFLKIKIENSERLHRTKSLKLQEYITEVIDYSSSQAVLQGEVEQAGRELLLKLQNKMQITRVSIWDIDKANKTLTCRLVNQAGELKEGDTTIRKEDCKNYFDHLLSDGIIIADHIVDHEATNCLNDSYLKSQKIRSLMNVIYLKDGKISGIISCENQHKLKKWTLEDSIFLKSMADMYSLMYANEKQLSRNEELEYHIKQRTSELEEKNKQLQEYAYINAHLLRAPVARVYGLYHLIESQYQNSPINEEILSHFRLSVEELDIITRKINGAIEELGTFTREAIR